MKATSFESRHQILLHGLLVGFALLTYVVYPDDIVWALVRHHSNSRLLERVAFGVGAIVMVGSAALETWATAYTQILAKGVVLRFRGPYRYFQYPLPLARLLLVSALGLLLPLPGTVVLIAGEAILVLRLRFRDQESTESQRLLQYRSTEPPLSAAVHSPLDGGARDGAWGRGFRTAASKWGLAASLILFTVTLQDRIAEIGAAFSFLIWLAMNAHHSIRSHS